MAVGPKNGRPSRPPPFRSSWREISKTNNMIQTLKENITNKTIVVTNTAI